MCKNAIDERSGINKLLDDLLIHLEQRGYAQSSLRTYGGIYKRLRAYCADKGDVTLVKGKCPPLCSTVRTVFACSRSFLSYTQPPFL